MADAQRDAALAWAFAVALSAARDARLLLRPGQPVARLRLAAVEVPRADGCRVVAVGPTAELGDWDVSRGHRLALASEALGLWASTCELRVPPAAPIPFRMIVVAKDGTALRESPLHMLEPLQSGERRAQLTRWAEDAPSSFFRLDRPKPPASFAALF